MNHNIINYLKSIGGTATLYDLRKHFDYTSFYIDINKLIDDKTLNLWYYNKQTYDVVTIPMISLAESYHEDR